jgi:hypothetical protein
MKRLLITLLLVSLLITSPVMVSFAKEPTATPTNTTVPTEAPTATPVPTEAPTDTPVPTEAPTDTPVPTEAPTDTPVPTEELTVTATPVLTETPTELATSTPTFTATVEVTTTATVTPVVGAAGEISAQALQWSSGVFVQNAGTAAANFTVRFIRSSDGGTQWTYDSSTNGPLAPGFMRSIPLTSLPSPFEGSAVVSGDQQMTALSRLDAASPTISTAYSSFRTGATTIYLPSVHRSSWLSVIAVQNIGTSATNVTVRFKASPSAGVPADVLKTVNNVQPNASAYFRTTNYSELGSNYYASAIVTSSSQPVVAAVQEYNEGSKVNYAYEGATQGEAATTLYQPSINRNAAGTTQNGWCGALLIQNIETFNANVNVHFLPASGYTASYHLYNQTIGPGAFAYFPNSLYTALGASWVGSAYVESTNGARLVGIGHQHYRYAAGPGPYDTTRLVQTARGTANSFLPLIYRTMPDGTSSYNTTIQVRNLSSSSAVNVNLYFYKNDGVTSWSLLNQSIAANSNNYWNLRATTYNALGNTWLGGVKVACTNCSGKPGIVVISIMRTLDTTMDQSILYLGDNL